MDDRMAVAWLARRVGFGLAPGELDRLAALGATGALDQLVDPDAHGVPPAPDPWQGLDLGFYGVDDERADGQRRDAITRWVAAMVSTVRPLEEWMRWFWHGHFVSTLRVVKDAPLMVGQLRTFAAEGLGDFRSLLRAVTVDPAMLIYLDGGTSRVGGINENYGREVLELFALGVGNYDEADVRAGAVAFTGWTVDRRAQAATFRPRLHDDTPQTYLGRSGVHDVDSAIDAIVGHSACAPFVAGTLAVAILGPGVDDGLVDRLASDFAASGLQLRPLVRAILEAGLDGAATPVVAAPVPWVAAALRATGSDPDALGRRLAFDLRGAGQVPMDAPNVGGWPGGRAWLSSSGTLSRFSLAGLIAEVAPDGPARQAATAGDLDALAVALGRPEGFSPATRSALAELPAGPPGAVGRLTVALASPDLEVG